VPGHYPLPIQSSRILLYAGYFFTGIGVGAVRLRAGMLAEHGMLVKRWMVWFAFAIASYGAILLLVYTHHSGLVDFNSPPLLFTGTLSISWALTVLLRKMPAVARMI
jgi:hypothetical protein